MIPIQITEQSQLTTVLQHYKKFYVSFGIILICIVLMSVFVIPQIQQYSDQQIQIEEAKSRISILHSNIAYIEKINGEEQSQQLATVLEALADDKDYSGILFAVRNASSKAEVGLDDFNFQVGELSSKNVITQQIPTLQIKLIVIGTPQQVGKFLKELSQTLPLSNVTEVNVGSASSQIIIEFYYKPIPQLQINYGQPIVSLNQANKKILEEIKAWQTDQTNFDSFSAPSSDASASASPFGL